MAYNVQSIIDAVSQDCRNQLASKVVGSPQTALIDYLDRIHKEVLRWSSWDFMETVPAYFLTAQGQTDYWVGPVADRPSGTVQTNLGINDMDRIAKDSMYDYSNFRQLKWFQGQPLGPVLTQSSGKSRVGQPAAWVQDYYNTPNIISIYPAPQNLNSYQPVPSTPVVDTLVSGALSTRVYYVKITLCDQNGGESKATNTSACIYIQANSVAVVRSPKLYFPAASNGIKYNGYNVYAVVSPNFTSNSQDPQSETLQNLTPIPLGTDWQEPNTGLTTTGVMWPQNSTIEPIGGYVIGFKYFRARKNLITVSDVPQVPEKYRDILIDGVSARAWALIGDDQKASMFAQKFSDGYRQMVVDKNAFPEGVKFIRPDAGSYVNQQILGYLPPFF
jgi:hypothetical protein